MRMKKKEQKIFLFFFFKKSLCYCEHKEYILAHFIIMPVATPKINTTSSRPVRACRLAPKTEIYKVDSDWEAIDDNDVGDYSSDEGWDDSDGISEVTIYTESDVSEDDEEGPRTKDGYLKDDFIASDSDIEATASVVSESELSADTADFSDASEVSLRRLVIDSSSEEEDSEDE